MTLKKWVHDPFILGTDGLSWVTVMVALGGYGEGPHTTYKKGKSPTTTSGQKLMS